MNREQYINYCYTRANQESEYIETIMKIPPTGTFWFDEIERAKKERRRWLRLAQNPPTWEPNLQPYAGPSLGKDGYLDCLRCGPAYWQLTQGADGDWKLICATTDCSYVASVNQVIGLSRT